MNKRFLVPAVGLLLLGGSALALADRGWRDDDRYEHGRHYRDGDHHGWRGHDWRGHGWGHFAPPPRWHGPTYYYVPPPVYGPHWGPPPGFGPWGPRPYYHPGAWEHGGWDRDGVTVILRSGFP